MKTSLLQILLLFTFPLFAQPVNSLKDTAEVRFAVLQDNEYTLEEVLKDKVLLFKETDSLIGAQSYWLRAVLHNPEAEDYILSVFPNKNTRLYRYNKEKKRWTSHLSDLKSSTRDLLPGRHPYHIAGLTTDTVYIKIDVSGPNIVNSKFKARIKFTSEEKAASKVQSIKIAWLIGMIVLLIFFLNNLFIYFSIKDLTFIYYLIMQIGAMLYLTSYWNLFIFDKLIVFSSLLVDKIYIYEINKLLNHISILIVFFGLIKLTRSYLKTKEYLRGEDVLLKYSLLTYIIFTLITTAISVSGFYVTFYTWKFDNLFCAFLILAVIFTSIKAYIKKLPLAEPYLLANLLPLIFVFSIPIYHLLISADNTANYMLPVFAVVSQALGFSIALVNRIHAVQEELKVKEIESRQLEFDMKEITYINKLNKLELEQRTMEISQEKERNEMLQHNLELNQRELASSALNMVQKNELLTLLRQQIQKLNWMDRYHTKKNVEELNQLLQSNIQLDNDWNKFKLHFEQVHPDFFENLKKQHPSLTAKEIRLYTYFEMNLSHKEIAALLDIDQASVRRAKTRLLKKMGQGLN